MVFNWLVLTLEREVPKRTWDLQAIRAKTFAEVRPTLMIIERRHKKKKENLETTVLLLLLTHQSFILQPLLTLVKIAHGAWTLRFPPTSLFPFLQPYPTLARTRVVRILLRVFQCLSRMPLPPPLLHPHLVACNHGSWFRIYEYVQRDTSPRLAFHNYMFCFMWLLMSESWNEPDHGESIYVWLF